MSIPEFESGEYPEGGSYIHAVCKPEGYCKDGHRCGKLDVGIVREPEHQHVWKYDHTYEDWWDGDEDDIYVCTVEGCNARDVRYIPR